MTPGRPRTSIVSKEWMLVVELESLDDTALVEKLRQAGTGDLRAFDVLVARHTGHVLANCRYLGGSADDAEDLAQEVFVKVYFALTSFEGRARFRTWMDRIKANHCIDYLRSKRAATLLDVDAPEHQHLAQLRVEPAAERRIDRSDEHGRIRHILAAVPETLRVPLVLRDMDGLSYQEIAEQLEIGLSAVKMRIKRGRDAFRAMYTRGQGTAQQEDEAGRGDIERQERQPIHGAG